MKKIAFFGATGMLGRPVVKELRKAGFSVKALVRNKEKALQCLHSSVELVLGDLQNEKAVAETLSGCDYVYANLAIANDAKPGDWSSENEGLELLLRLSKAQGIQRFSYISSLIKDHANMNWWIFEKKKDSVEILRKSTLPTTIFYPSAFMETLRDRQLAGNALRTAGKSLHPLHWIAGEDYGRMVAKDFTLEGTEKREFVIQGIDRKLVDEAAKDFASHYPGGVKIQHAPLGVLRFFGLFSPAMKFAANITQAINTHPEKFEGEEAWKTLGKPILTVAEFAMKGAFTPQ